jgi:hypothetical protein
MERVGVDGWISSAVSAFRQLGLRHGSAIMRQDPIHGEQKAEGRYLDPATKTWKLGI